MMPLAAHFAAALLAGVWQGLLLTALVACILRLAPGIPSAVRSALWTAVFLCTVALHFIPASPSHATRHGSPLWSLVLDAVWLALVLRGAAQLVASALRLHAIARRATPIRHNIPAGRLRRSATLCLSPEVDRPLVLGLFRSPRILLPEALFASLTPIELEHILLHETGHLRRADDWANLLQKLVLVLFPLNPALRWIEHRLCEERELACDDHVLAATGAPKAYAFCLASLAEHAAFSRALSLAIGAWQRPSELAMRVDRILRRPPHHASRPRTAAVAAAALLGLTAGAGTLAHTPQLVSFLPSPAAPASFATTAAITSVTTAAPAFSQTPAHAVLAGYALPTSGSTSIPAPRPKRAATHHPAHFTSRFVRTAWSPAPRAGFTRTAASVPETDVADPAAAASPRLSAVPAFVPVVHYFIATPDGWLIVQL